MEHKSGYVNIVGNPNVGKSTLMNALMGERMSIITHKPQTTRHRLLGIWNDDNHQIVFSDTPGFVENPAYRMHEFMNKFSLSAFEDADLVIFMTDMQELIKKDTALVKALKKVKAPVFLLVNKIDLSKQEAVLALLEKWKAEVDFKEVFAISALNEFGIGNLLEKIKEFLPDGPPYFPKDQLSDKPERFFASEIIREKILLLYKEEIPYSCEVEIEEFKHQKHGEREILHIHGIINVSRRTQKAIILGKQGHAIKKLGILARKEMELFFGNDVFLKLYVKMKENWRDDERMLKQFGYNR
jgi:GTP-binding protein Era